MIISIKKRDGRVVPFDPSKIEHGRCGACASLDDCPNILHVEWQ